MKVFLLFPLCLLILACENTQYADNSTPISDKQAIINLREDALRLSDQGFFDKAIATLERALRIEPNNALLWFDLAKQHASTEDTLTAKNIALKAMSLSENSVLKKQITNFITDL